MMTTIIAAARGCMRGRRRGGASMRGARTPAQQKPQDGSQPDLKPVFVVKAAIDDQHAKTFIFAAQKTMYGGKRIAVGDAVFIFASENEGGRGLIARGVVGSAETLARKPGVIRQTPRVSITIRRTALAVRSLGRAELKRFSAWDDGRPETELNFKLYRQATNKIVAISQETAAFLSTLF